MASVQFYGKSQVMAAHENNNVPTWAIFSGRQLLFKYAGDDMAESAQLLEDLFAKIHRSTAVYTLKFYEDLKEGQKIKENTPCDSSFNFKLFSEEEIEGRQQQFTGGLRAEIAELKEIVLAMTAADEQDEQEENEKPNSINGVLMGLLQNPQQLIGLIEAGKTLLGINRQAPGSAPVQLAGFPEQSTTMATPAGTAPKQAPTDPLALAIDTLAKNDPEIIRHLGKLAQLSENDPATFSYLLSMLDKM